LYQEARIFNITMTELICHLGSRRGRSCVSRKIYFRKNLNFLSLNCSNWNSLAILHVYQRKLGIVESLNVLAVVDRAYSLFGYVMMTSPAAKDFIDKFNLVDYFLSDVIGLIFNLFISFLRNDKKPVL
jgi:hypothetical protein